MTITQKINKLKTYAIDRAGEEFKAISNIHPTLYGKTIEEVVDIALANERFGK
jgi:hypothetical protein